MFHIPTSDIYNSRNSKELLDIASALEILLIYNSRNSKELLDIIMVTKIEAIYNSRNSKELLDPFFVVLYKIKSSKL